MQLRNGAEVLDSRANRNQCFVLANFGGLHPYVTWCVDVDGNCFHGNYFADLERAVQDFKDRCLQSLGVRV